MIKPRLLIAALAAALLLVVPAGAGAAAGHRNATLRAQGRTVTVDIAIDRFATRHHRAVALATASSRVPTRGGRYFRTVSRRVTLSVRTGASCRILTLHLATLKLTLLGLTVDTSAVNLNVTGNHSGALGTLFCKLASGLKLKSTARMASATRALNRHMRHRRMHALRFRARISPQTKPRQAPPAATCPVLSLTLGPLNLDLLGLFVDLYGPTAKDPVTVTITADPNGGSLGKLFCQLASNAQSSSSSSSSSPPA